MEAIQIENNGEYTKLFDQAYNVGIERCISFVKSQHMLYNALDPRNLTGTATVLESIVETLEHFKKATPEPINNEATA